MVAPQRSATIHSAQASDNPAERKEEIPLQPNSSKMQPDVLSELKEMRSNMAEVAQIKEFMQKPQCSPPQYQNQVEVPQNSVSHPTTVPSLPSAQGPFQVTTSEAVTISMKTCLPPSLHSQCQPLDGKEGVSLVSKTIRRIACIAMDAAATNTSWLVAE